MADEQSNNNPQGTPDATGGQTAQISGTVRLETPLQAAPPAAAGSDPSRPASVPNGNVPPAEEEPAPKRPIYKNPFVLLGVAAVILIVSFFIWRSSFTEDTDDAQVDGDLYQVSSRVAGQVLHVDVQDNQVVYAGQQIAEIDPKDLQVALTQAEAALASSQADLTQASVNVPITTVNVRTSLNTSGSGVLGSQASVLSAQAQQAAAEARVRQAQANAVKAQSDVDRYTPLVQKDVISKQQYDAAVAQAQAATAAVAEAQRNVAAQREMVANAQQRLAQSREQQKEDAQNGPQQVRVQQSRVAAAQAAVEQAQAKVDQARLNLGYTKIFAPVAGIIDKKNVEAGQNLSVGQDLLTIVPIDNLWVTANLKETQLKSIQQNQVVDIKVDALGGRHFKGYVQQIGGATGSRLSLFPPENATGNYVKVVQRIPVRINFSNLAEENKDHALRPGMSVTPSIHVK